MRPKEPSASEGRRKFRAKLNNESGASPFIGNVPRHSCSTQGDAACLQIPRTSTQPHSKPTPWRGVFAYQVRSGQPTSFRLCNSPCQNDATHHVRTTSPHIPQTFRHPNHERSSIASRPLVVCRTTQQRKAEQANDAATKQSAGHQHMLLQTSHKHATCVCFSSRTQMTTYKQSASVIPGIFESPCRFPLCCRRPWWRATRPSG